MSDVPTQSEILQRQSAAVGQLEQNTARLNDFMHNPAGETVTTESGPIPTLSGLVEEIRQRVGYRRYEICWSVENLERYANLAEAMFRTIHTAPLYVTPELVGSFFKLAQPSSQPLSLRLVWGQEQFVIHFAANATDGVVQSSTMEIVTQMPAGSTVSCFLVGSAWNARGLHMTVLGLVEAPTEPQ